MNQPRIFISYSHEDEEWLSDLLDYLEIAFEEYAFELFTDKQIEPGEDWEQRIREAIEKATIAILLVSVKSLRSDYIRRMEIPYLQEKALPIIPIIVRPCPWEQLSWLKAMKVLPKDGQPLAGRGQYEIEREMSEIASTLVKTLYPDAGQYGARRREDRQSTIARRRSPEYHGDVGVRSSLVDSGGGQDQGWPLIQSGMLDRNAATVAGVKRKEKTARDASSIGFRKSLHHQ